MHGAAGAAQVRVALVIGNSAYQHVNQLPNATTDAKLMNDTFKLAGFGDVMLVNNSTRADLDKALRTFAGKAAQADVALIYYAGHGVEWKGENYLIPVDAKLEYFRDVELSAIKLSTMMDIAQGAKRLSIVILDACRTPPEGLKPDNASRGLGLGRGLAPVEPEGESLVVYSAKAGTTAADGSGKNSPFAVAMARRMLQPGREISLLFRDIRDDVLQSTGQQQQPFTYGSLSGREFYFIDPPKGGVAAIDIEAAAWDLCRTGASRAPCTAYVRDYPKGRYLGLVRTRMADLPANAVVTNTVLNNAGTSNAEATPAIVKRPPASNQIEMVQQLGLSVRATDDGSGIVVQSVSSNGPAFGQLFAGDVIVGINSGGMQRDLAPSRQLVSAMDDGRVKLLVRRGPTSTMVVLHQ